MAGTILGVHKWGPMTTDDEGQRTYSITFKVEAASVAEGPATIAQTPGLPAVGSTWNIASDIDAYAYRTPYLNVSSLQEGDSERALYWYVEQKFTTRPMFRCNTAAIGDPLSEPPEIRGGFAPYREEQLFDRFGNFLLMSSLERMTGPQVEVEKGRPIVNISMNVATLPLVTFSTMMSTGAVNDSTLWGCPARTVRLAEITWERMLFGVCTYYYKINYAFEIKFEGWNRLIMDEGTKIRRSILTPIGPGNPLVPWSDWYTQQPQTVYLNGSADAVDVARGDSPSGIWVWEKELEEEYNFLSLGIPSSL